MKEALIKFQQKNDPKASLNVGVIYTSAGVRLHLLNILLTVGNIIYLGHSLCCHLLQCSDTRAGDFRRLLSDSDKSVRHQNKIIR